MTSMVTQCPKCGTSFRVTTAQLSVADGAVRCGSCLHIFNAQAHRHEETSQLEAENFESDSNTSIDSTDNGDRELLENIPQSDVLDDIFSDDPLELDADFGDFSDNVVNGDTLNDADEENLVDSQANQSAETSTPWENSAEVATTENSPEPSKAETRPEELEIYDGDLGDLLIGDDDDDELSLDDADDEILLDDGDDEILLDDDDDDVLIDDGSDREQAVFEEGMLGDDNLGKNNTENRAEFSDTFLELDADQNEHTVYRELDDLGETDDDDDAEGWARELLKESASDDPEEEDFGETFDELSSVFEREEDTKLDPELLDIIHEREQSISESAEDEFVIEGESLVAGDRIGHSSSELIANIEPEPVQMVAAKDHRHWIQRIWAIAIVLAVGGLLAQYIYFNYDSIARDPSSRPMLLWSCELLGCKVPSPNDIDKIRSNNLLIRSHPSRQNALVVDAILTNRADFAQNFPMMELQFTDLEGTLVAQRIFSPSEYIRGELTGSNNMPSNQPIYISFEIVDPGPRAVNYQLVFHSKASG